MKSLFILLAFKVLSFIGATLHTVGLLTFFFWQSLEPYRWHMILGGIALISVSELLSYFFIKRIKGESHA